MLGQQDHEAQPYTRAAGSPAQKRRGRLLAQVEPGAVLRSMPKPQDADFVLFRQDAIEDEVVAFDELAHSGTFRQPRAALTDQGFTEAQGAIHQLVPEPLRRIGVVSCDVADDLLQVAGGVRGKDYLVCAHAFTFWRTSSADKS